MPKLPAELGTETGKAIKPKPPTIRSIPLKEDQYYQGVYKKDKIILHHTAGGSVAGAVSSWAADARRVATPYIIERSGDIYECFPPQMWAYHLGVKIPKTKELEQSSIGIEIVAYGQLTKKDGKYYTYTNRELPLSEVAEVSFREFAYYQKYTDAQIKALSELLPYLVDRFKIPLQTDRAKFWEYRDPTKLPSGIWSHTTVRKDKVDIFPQKELVDLVYSL